MHARTPFAALAATAFLALPGSALAAGGTTVTAGPLKVKGYELFVVGSDAGANDSVSLILTRRSGTSTQSHNYSFSDGVSVTAASSLASASIKGSLGRFGKLDLKFAPGAKSKGVVPKGCTGKPGAARKGTFKGTFRFVADSTYFKTISRKKLKGGLSKGGSLKCEAAPGGNNGSGSGSSGTTLSSTQNTPDGMLSLIVSRVGSKVSQTLLRSDDAQKTAPASVSHFITAQAPASGLEASADGSSATVKGAGPFLKGGLSFAGEPVGGGFSTGTISGDLVGRFDSIGAITVAAGEPDAQLITR